MVKKTFKTIYDYFHIKRKGIGRLLDLPMPGFEEVSAKYLAHSRKKVSALTLTLKPIYHCVDPDVMSMRIYKSLKLFFGLMRKMRFCVKLWFEFTENGILHLHGFFCGSAYSTAKFLAYWRRTYGFVLRKTPKDLAGWLKYCGKDQKEMPFVPITHWS